MNAQNLTTVGEVLDNMPVPEKPTSMGDGILSVIARAAADPNVDIDKLERLLEMQERVLARDAKAQFTSALAELQPLLPTIDEKGGIKDRNGNVQSTYALWEDINEAIKPLLAEYGFALSFRTQRSENEITVTGVLSHRGGHSEETELSLPSDTSGSKNAVQAVGSSTSYGKRYTAMALLNLTSRGLDDDGKAGGAVGCITRQQWEEIEKLADDAGADKRRLSAYLGVESLRDLPMSRYDDAKRAIAAKRNKANG